MDRRRIDGLMSREHERIDADLVLDALVWAEGNESEASRILCVNRNTVRRVRASKLAGVEVPAREGYVFRTRPEGGAPWVS